MTDSPNPFQSSPIQSRTASPSRSAPQSPGMATQEPWGDHEHEHQSSNPSARSAGIASPTPSFPRPPSSMISAASGSPPPTHRASFPDASKEPRKGSSRLSGPLPKQGTCCDRDRDISKGEEISIVDAFKTTEGGKASYITYVIRLGVSLACDGCIRSQLMDSRTRRDDGIRLFSLCTRRYRGCILF